MSITKEYVRELPKIYQDILLKFPELEPGRKAGYGLAYQTLSAALSKYYSFGEIVKACENMATGGAVEIKNRIFVHPTDIGEEIIAEMVGHKAPEQHVPDFVPPK
jgi:hypothetical protein